MLVHLLLEPAPDPDDAGMVMKYMTSRELSRPVRMRRRTIEYGAHIPTLVDFWTWQLLGDRRYHGHPMRAHEHAHEGEAKR